MRGIRERIFRPFQKRPQFVDLVDGDACTQHGFDHPIAVQLVLIRNRRHHLIGVLDIVVVQKLLDLIVLRWPLRSIQISLFERLFGVLVDPLLNRHLGLLGLMLASRAAGSTTKPGQLLLLQHPVTLVRSHLWHLRRAPSLASTGTHSAFAGALHAGGLLPGRAAAGVRLFCAFNVTKLSRRDPEGFGLRLARLSPKCAPSRC
eukprot:6451867-Prymnesium_polylepis.1